MSKPVVILTPHADREALRTCGVLPVGNFHSFDGTEGPGASGGGEPLGEPVLHLWPYTISYALTEDWAKRVAERPVEFAVFLGMDEADDDEELRANEVKIARLLGSTMVHVVFLDKTGESRPEYTAFRSFKEITEWSRQFKAVLDVRFRNEATLQQVENVLVIVARGGQVQTTPEELADFKACVGREACFKICYFLDYNISVGDTHELFHSHAVWDVMVGRLLLAFLLSRERDQPEPIWMRGGVRLWRAGECSTLLPADFCSERVKEALSAAYESLPDKTDDAGASDPAAAWVEPGEPAPLPELTAQESQTGMPAGGWVDFHSRNFSETVADPGKWSSGLAKIRNAVETRRKDHTSQSATSFSKGNVFERSHQSPGVLFKESERLENALRQAREWLRKAQSSELASNWSGVVDKERARCAKLGEVRQAAEALSLAQRHYLGIGPALLVVVAISSMCGFVIHRLVEALDGSLPMSLWLAGTTCVGSAVAAIATMATYCRHGLAGTRALLQMGDDAASLMIQRDASARALVSAAERHRAQLKAQNARFRTWLLLNRIKSILITEIQPSASVEPNGEDAYGEGPEPSPDGRRREQFLEKTRTALKIKAVLDNDLWKTHVLTLVKEWWGDSAQNHSFRVLWSSWCQRHDRKAAGNFPAHVFIPAIRDFVVRFRERVQREVAWQTLHEPSNLQEVAKALSKWKHQCTDGNPREFCSGAITGLHDREDEQQGKRLYLRQDDALTGGLNAPGRIDGRQNALQLPCETLNHLDQLAFFYQEFSVEFDIDPETRHLTFKEVSDVR